MARLYSSADQLDQQEDTATENHSPFAEVQQSPPPQSAKQDLKAQAPPQSAKDDLKAQEATPAGMKVTSLEIALK